MQVWHLFVLECCFAGELYMILSYLHHVMVYL